MSSPEPPVQNAETAWADWQEYRKSLVELLARAICVEVQRIEAAQPFTIVEPPTPDDIEKLEGTHHQLAAYVETPSPPDVFIAADSDELPMHVKSMKEWIQESRQAFIEVARENIGLKRSQAQRDDGRHTLNTLRIEFETLFAVLGRCPSLQGIPRPHREGPLNKDEYTDPYPNDIRDIDMDIEGSPTQTNKTAASSVQSMKQRRINSILETLTSLMTVQETNQGQLRDITTKMATLDKPDTTYAPNDSEPTCQSSNTTEWYYRIVRNLSLDIVYEGRSWLSSVLQEDQANMMMDVHFLSGYPWRQIDLWKRKQRLTTELLAEYLRSLPDLRPNEIPLSCA